METVGDIHKSNTVPRRTFHNSNWSGSSCRERPPKPVHSISTTSLMPVEDTNVYTDGIYRTQSKPELELERHQATYGVHQEAPNSTVSDHSHLLGSLPCGGQDKIIGIGLQFALMNLRSLQDQISHLNNHLASTEHQSSPVGISASPSSSLRTRIQCLLRNAGQGVRESAINLESACAIVGAGRVASASELPPSTRSTPARDYEGGAHHRTSASSSRKFSRSSSGGVIPVSRQSSGLSVKGTAKGAAPSSSTGGIDARKQLTFDQCELSCDRELCTMPCGVVQSLTLYDNHTLEN